RQRHLRQAPREWTGAEAQTLCGVQSGPPARKPDRRPGRTVHGGARGVSTSDKEKRPGRSGRASLLIARGESYIPSVDGVAGVFMSVASSAPTASAPGVTTP